MPLNLKVEGEPSSLRSAAEWLSKVEGAIHDGGSQLHKSRSESESAWTGEAGESFRSGLSRVGPQVDDVAVDHAAACRELNSHADDLDTVQQRIEQARAHALEAGLQVQGDEILEPGPAPTPPAPLPSDKPATVEQEKTHAAGVQAQQAYARRMKAYQECSQTIDEARKKEHASQNKLIEFVLGVAEKSPFTITDSMSGLAGAVATRTSAFRAAATKIAESGKLERAARLMHSPNLSLQHQTRAAAIHAQNSVNMKTATRQAQATATARLVDRMPGWAKTFVKTGLDFNQAPKYADSGSKLLRGSLSVGSKLPVAGLLIAGAGIGYDVGVSGKNVGTSVASNLGGWAAGAGASAAVLAAGGPVGWAVGLGAVASIGVGYAVEEWGDDAVNLAGDAANAVGDFVGDLF